MPQQNHRSELPKKGCNYDEKPNIWRFSSCHLAGADSVSPGEIRPGSKQSRGVEIARAYPVFVQYDPSTPAQTGFEAGYAR
jgi:hypothetical protein